MSTEIGTAANHLDLLIRLDAFLCNVGHAWGVSFAGTGNGRITDYRGTATSVAEIWTLTAISATVFTVTGSVSGVQPNATVGTPYTAPRIAFTLTAGSTAFAVGDVYLINTSAPWQRRRLNGSINFWGAGTWDVNNPAMNAFNNQSIDAISNALPSQLGVTMFVPSEVRQVRLTCGSAPSQGPRDFTLQRSADGSTWFDVQSWAAQTWTMARQVRFYNVAAAPGAHLHWRINFTAANAMPMQVNNLALLNAEGAAWDLTSRIGFAWANSNFIVNGLIRHDRNFNLTFSCSREHHHLADDLSQFGASPPVSVSTINGPMPYWFTANDRRVIVVIRVSSVYQMAYLGLGLPYEPPRTHPWPMIAAGSNDGQRDWNDVTENNMMPYWPGNNHAFINNIGGLWVNVNSTIHNSRASTIPSGMNLGRILPTRNNVLIPFLVVENLGNNNFQAFGEFEGLYRISRDNQVETLIRSRTIGHEYDYLVVNNVFRNGNNDICALQLD